MILDKKRFQKDAFRLIKLLDKRLKNEYICRKHAFRMKKVLETIRKVDKSRHDDAIPAMQHIHIKLM